MEKNNKLTIIPVMLCFFAMGFVDLVGTASNYVKSDLGLKRQCCYHSLLLLYPYFCPSSAKVMF